HQRQRRHALARAGFAHDAERLAGMDLEAHAVDGAHRPVIGEELRLEVRNLEHGQIGRRGRRASPLGALPVARGDVHRRLAFGSRKSRTPSPRKLKPSTTVKIAKPGKAATHHCSTSSRPSATIEPHSGVGGTTPSPRKERPAKVMIALPTSSVTSTTSGPIAFGMT